MPNDAHYVNRLVVRLSDADNSALDRLARRLPIGGGTRSEAVRQAVRIANRDLDRRGVGEAPPRRPSRLAKPKAEPRPGLTDEQKAEVVRLKGTASCRDVAEMFGVSRMTIHRLWRSVP